MFTNHWRQQRQRQGQQQQRAGSFSNRYDDFIVCLILFVYCCLGEADAEYVANMQAQNFSCVNWQQAPEAKAGNCTRFGKFGALRCFGGMNNLPALIEPKTRKLKTIILCGWPAEVFNPRADLQPFPELRNLTIEYSGFKEFVFDFPEMFFLQSINISWTNLSHISSRTFKLIHTLRVLDLRWNQLVQLEGPLVLTHSFEQLYLAGNPWNCTRNFKWLLQNDKGALVSDRAELMCADRKYKDRNMLTVMQYKVILKTQCQAHPDLRNCTCIMHHIIPKSHIPLYTVNCSGQQFYSLPAYLPENTTMLFANDNMISDINPLRYNEHYRHVVDIHLDNNRIENIDELENTYWLENFRLFSLRGNRLKKVHVYALDNALEDNENANLMQLGVNPWFCTCKFAMRFRELLNKYHDIIRDASNITCSYLQGDEVHSIKVLAITRHDICNVATDNTKIHAIDWLNGVLASLIVFILGKLAYDYYHYKNYGRVPWIVMKMP